MKNKFLIKSELKQNIGNSGIPTKNAMDLPSKEIVDTLGRIMNELETNPSKNPMKLPSSDVIEVLKRYGIK